MASIHERTDLAADAVNQALRASPAVAVATPALLGADLNSVVLVLTGLYILLQIGFLLHKWVRMSRGKSAPQDSVE
jgi:hypothetical protein